MIKVRNTTVDHVTVLSLEGKLTGFEGRGVIQEKVRESAKGESNNVVLDLTKVTWIDSTGLGELIASLSSTKKNGGNLVLTNIQAPVQSLLKMTNLDQIFDTYDDVSDAVTKLNG